MINTRLNENLKLGDFEEESSNKAITEAFCFNCEKGFGVNDGGYFIVDEPYCSLECLVEYIIKNINGDNDKVLSGLNENFLGEALNHLINHYNLDERMLNVMINHANKLGADYLVIMLEGYHMC